MGKQTLFFFLFEVAMSLSKPRKKGRKQSCQTRGHYPLPGIKIVERGFQMVWSELNRTQGKREEKSSGFLFRRQLFAHALLSERLEQAKWA